MHGELPPDGGRLQGAPPGHEKRLADALFEQRQSARERGLGHPDQGRALGDAARIDGGGELHEMAFVDFHNNRVYCSSIFLSNPAKVWVNLCEGRR